jgi:hypothetical protein
MANIRRFPWLSVAPIAATAVLYVAHGVVRDLRPVGHPLRLTLTLMLVMSFAFTIRVMARQLVAEDEFHRQVLLSTLTFAFPASLIAAFAIGFFMNEVGQHWADPRDLPSVMLVTYIMGYSAAWRSVAASE